MALAQLHPYFYQGTGGGEPPNNSGSADTFPSYAAAVFRIMNIFGLALLMIGAF